MEQVYDSECQAGYTTILSHGTTEAKKIFDTKAWETNPDSEKKIEEH